MRNQRYADWERRYKTIFAHKWHDNLCRKLTKSFPGGAVVENPPANAGDTGSSPGPGRSHMPQGN